jgi:hypothetical protein
MDDRGTALPVLAVLLAAGLAALALAVELGRFAAAAREVAFAADAGAEAGAAVIDTEAAYAGELIVDPVPAAAVARNAAERARPRPGRRIDVHAGEHEVCVSVQWDVRPGLLGVFGAGTWTASATGCAVPARG